MRPEETGAALIEVIAQTEPDRWGHSPAPGVWSIAKDADHVIEAYDTHRGLIASQSRVIGGHPPAPNTAAATD